MSSHDKYRNRFSHCGRKELLQDSSSSSSSQSSSRSSSMDRQLQRSRCSQKMLRSRVVQRLEAGYETISGTGESIVNDSESYIEKCLKQLDENIGRKKKKRKKYLNTVSYATQFFAGGVFDYRGGELVLADGDIRLRITPNAVNKNYGPYKVYIHLPYNMKEYPKTSGVDGMYLSPVIRCGPHGLAFEKPILLLVKTVVQHGEYNSFKVLKSDTKLSEECSWQEVGTDEAHCVWSPGPDRGYCITALKHFTLYRVIGMHGESILKGVFKLLVFMEYGKERSIKLRVRVFPDTVADLQVVKQAESEIGGSLVEADTSRIISIEANKGLVVNLTDISPEDWNLIHHGLCEVKPEHIWKGQSSQPSGVVRTFSLESKTGLLDSFGCRVAVREHGRPDTEVNVYLRRTLFRQQPCTVLVGRLKSTARRQSSSSENPSARVDAVDRAFRNSLPEFQRAYNDRFSDIMNYDLYVDLCVKLDIENNCDARYLAENLGLKTETITYLTSNVNGQQRSLTSCLLDFFIERGIQSGSSKREILTDLEERLRKIGHEQAANLVRDHLGKKMSVCSVDSGFSSSVDEGETTN